VLTSDRHAKPRAEASAAATPAFSIITTCKGRLEHLKQSLPRMAVQAGAEVIVVDYDCPDGTGDWVAENFPAVRVVRVQNAPIFRIAHARNLGAAEARGRWLCFVDADILLDERFAVQALPLLQEGAFYSFAHPMASAYGTVSCQRDDFSAIGGYDEVMEGYATEDRDLYLRLLAHGRRREMLPGDWVQTIEHDRDASVRYHEIRDHALNQRINATYVQIKQDLARQLGAQFLTVAARRTIYAEVRRTLRQAAQSGQPAARVSVTLPPDLDVRLYGWQMTRTWIYQLNPLRQAAEPGAGLVAGDQPAGRGVEV